MIFEANNLLTACGEKRYSIPDEKHYCQHDIEEHRPPRVALCLDGSAPISRRSRGVFVCLYPRSRWRSLRRAGGEGRPLGTEQIEENLSDTLNLYPAQLDYGLERVGLLVVCDNRLGSKTGKVGAETSSDDSDGRTRGSTIKPLRWPPETRGLRSAQTPNSLKVQQTSRGDAT